MEGQIELEDYLRSLNCEGFDICDYIPKGRANAVTRYELCMKTGFRDRQIRDFEQDAECIYSAFREVYGINLQTIPYMHWWEFQTLFAGLPEKTEIKQRIMYRSIDLRTIKDKDERKRIKKIQEIVALKKKNRRKMTDYEIGEMFA